MTVYCKKFPSNTAIHYLKQDDECLQYLDTLIDECVGYVYINWSKSELIGYVFVYKEGRNKRFIFNLFVVEKYGGQGFGDRLTKDAIHKLNGIDLTVGKDNEVAINLYKKNGFVIVGDGNTEDEYYMKLRGITCEKFKTVSKRV